MRRFLATVRILASLVYCALALLACIVGFLVVWGLIAGGLPFAGVLAHGNISLPEGGTFFVLITIVLLIIGCDVYFRITNKDGRPDQPDARPKSKQ